MQPPPRTGHGFVSLVAALWRISSPGVVFKSFTLTRTFPLFPSSKQSPGRVWKPSGQGTRLTMRGWDGRPAARLVCRTFERPSKGRCESGADNVDENCDGQDCDGCG